MNIEELDSYNLKDAVKFHDRLNPRLWDNGENLRPKVRDKLLEIAADFEEFLGLDSIAVQDITISGSNAAYNYTDHSDIDLHLIVDMPNGDSAEVYRELFNAKKYQYNDQHSIRIGQYDVELYVQDATEKHHSQGIYSVKNNDWISVPRRRTADVNDIDVRSKYEDLGARIESILDSKDHEQLARMMSKIKDMRGSGLEKEGEFGVDNIVFKLLRNNGLIKQLVDARNAARDHELSLTERNKKKKRVKYGYSGYWTPGYDLGGTELGGGGDAGGGGESVSPSTKMFLEQDSRSVADIVKDFVSYCAQELSIEQQPQLQLRRDPAWSQRNRSFGRFDPETNRLDVCIANRHVMDVLRTIAHELVHYHQQEQQDLPHGAGETGSKYENEANARAGEIMRNYGQAHPELFDADDEVAEGWKQKLGSAAMAAACAVGAPGCSTTGALQGAQLIGRMAQTMQGKDIKNVARAELEQEIKDYAQAQRGDANAQNRSRMYQLQKKQSQQNESSGYIPTGKEKNDPRFSMALTKDVRPGAVGKNANKLGLRTGPQGEPTLLVNNIRNALREFKEGKPSKFPDYYTQVGRTQVKESKEELAEEDIFEISMRPSMLRQAASNINARAGMEFEMIVPNAKTDEDDFREPDYDEDQRSRSWGTIEEFFLAGDELLNARSDVQRALEILQEEFFEWADNEARENFDNEASDVVTQWVRDNVSDEDILDYGNYDDEDREKFAEDSEFRDKVIKDYVDNAIEKQTGDYDSAQEEYMDDMRGDYDESGWLQSNYPYMSDVESGFSLNWPYYSQGNNGETDVDTVAADFTLAIDKPVNASSSYHSAERNDTDYIVEPDSSLEADDGDAGLEFISPPMPVDEMFSDMDKIVKWAVRYGCYTNNSTGLHMNISVPGMSTAKLDFVKLALLMGDEYVLEKFGRESNTYAKSAMQIVRDRVSTRPEDAEAMLNQMKEHLGALATKIIHSGETSKYTSINTKDGYVEFRSPGGDWLSSYNQDKGNIENTMLRFVVALDAAMDPEKYRKEYLTKLYKLLAPKGGTDTLAYFAKFAAGELPRSALKSFVKQAQLERSIKKGVAPAVSTVNEPRPAGNTGSIQYEMFNRDSGEIMRRYWAANDEMALDMGNRYREQAMTELVLTRSSIGLRAVPTNQQSAPVPGSTLDRQQQRDAQTPQQTPSGSEFSGTWVVKDANDREIYRFSGVGNRQDDANRVAAAWLRQNPGQVQTGVTVVPVMR